MRISDWSSDVCSSDLNVLRDRGVLALLDDFGTGFSALSYLHRFPIQALKIDQSFVAGLGGEMHAESLALVRAILALAGTLGIAAIGEGVVTREQRDILRQLGCDFGQGYPQRRPSPELRGNRSRLGQVRVTPAQTRRGGGPKT